jgi:uncharacterized protein DUF3515
MAAADKDTPAEATDSLNSPKSGANTTKSPYPPALIATAVALPVALVAGMVVAAFIALRASDEPLALGPVPAPTANSPECATLIGALPEKMGDFTETALVDPAPPATRAWRAAESGASIVLRCGVERPLEFHRAAPLQLINNVQWFQMRDPGGAASTWFAVDRGVYLALTSPDSAGPTPLQEISDRITAHLPARPLNPGELPN